MSVGLNKSSKIRHIVRLRQMLRRWREKAALSSSSRRLIPSDVPSGHIAVVVGPSYRRFVVRATYLNHPVFKKLLILAEEEYGFSNLSGPLSIPCDETVFEDILRFMSRNESSRFVSLEDFQRSYNNCHVGVRTNIDTWPLLEKSVW